ncbi:hypothetical protein TNCV_1071741 [Trichonephila clavipes]|nr:hypothetical protein TNCV_1071741 [Trichonephila clavipes]
MVLISEKGPERNSDTRPTQSCFVMFYFQWIPSHIGLFGNDTADLLAKEGVTENLMSRRTLTFSEIFSKTKSLIQELWKTPPIHPWYNRQAPGGALSIKAD